MNRWIKILMAVLATLVVAFSCTVHSSKERYLANFERFVSNVEKNAGDFKAKDWRWASNRYNLYSGKWYQKYRDELTPAEQLRVAALKIRYQVVKEGPVLRKQLDEELTRNLDKLSEDVGKYLDDNLDRQLEQISKGAREIGDSAIKVVEDLIKELRRPKEK